jgi:hypothetical protein
MLPFTQKELNKQDGKEHQYYFCDGNFHVDEVYS